MRSGSKVAAISAAALITGCSSYSAKPETTILPTSNTTIDVVLHRSDVRLLDCATLAVIQTYASDGKLIDAKSARGNALHCAVIPALIDAGGRVGAAAVVRPAVTNIKNAVNSAASAGASATAVQAQAQQQLQQQQQHQKSINLNINKNVAEGGNNGGGNGNNGGGNGDNDGTNPGTDHHHDNGDND